MRKIKSKSKPARQSRAKERLLKAAATVFARDGLAGATTRAIAREAAVNEVTLFRLFGSKKKLIAAVVGRTFAAAQTPAPAVLPKPTGDLRADLANYARRYEAMLTENLPLLRTLIGEIHHHRDQERKVVDGIFRPLRVELVARLESMQRRRAMRSGISAAVAIDLLGGMIFVGVLRRASPNKPTEYSPTEYLEQCVEVLTRGIEAKRR